MPTKNPRTNITHTPEVRRALEVARERWPNETTDSALILHLMKEGAQAIEASVKSTAQHRRTVIGEIAGKYSDAYEEDYLANLREGWDE